MNENVNVDLQEQNKLEDILSQVKDMAKFGHFELSYVEANSILIGKLISMGYNCIIEKEKADGSYLVLISWKDVGIPVNTTFYSAGDAYKDANNTLGIILYYIKHKALSGNVSIDFRYQMNISANDIEKNISELRLRGFTIVDSYNCTVVSWKTLPSEIMERDFTARNAKELAIQAQLNCLKGFCDGKQLSPKPFIPYDSIYKEVLDELKVNGYKLDFFQ